MSNTSVSIGPKSIPYFWPVVYFNLTIFYPYFIWSGHGATAVSFAWFCYQLMAKPGGTTAARASENWPICIHPRVYMCMNLPVYRCVYIYLPNFTTICSLVFLYYYLILIINLICDEKIIYMCLPSVYMILHAFNCFYHRFLVYVCIHALLELRNKTVKSVKSIAWFGIIVKIFFYINFEMRNVSTYKFRNEYMLHWLL